jgi:hypothetical protein
MAFNLNDYVDVAERLRILKKEFPEAVVRPLDPLNPYKIETIGDQTFIVYTAMCLKYPTEAYPAVAVAWEEFPGKTQFTRGSELMNAETSAWGRCIVAALVADTKKIASFQEVRNRQDTPPPVKAGGATEKQIDTIRKLAKEAKIDNLAGVASEMFERTIGSSKSLTAKEATDLITHLISVAEFADVPLDDNLPEIS